MASRRHFLKSAASAGGGALFGGVVLNELSPWIWSAPLELDQNSSFWGRSQASRNSGLPEDQVVDVAVIGGGLTGLSAAYYIRRISPDKRVALLEAHGCGNGASGRNG